MHASCGVGSDVGGELLYLPAQPTHDGLIQGATLFVASQMLQKCDAVNVHDEVDGAWTPATPFVCSWA